MLGYPGAGKTTVAKLLHELTGAQHLWADHVRREMYKNPTYSHSENLHLYAHLNDVTDKLLSAGKSVIYDTNFNFYKDRKKLSLVADQYGFKTVVIYVQTPKEIAEQRATIDAHLHKHTRVLGHMPKVDFERMTSNLELPGDHENVVAIDGTKVSKDYLHAQLAAAGIEI